MLCLAALGCGEGGGGTGTDDATGTDDGTTAPSTSAPTSSSTMPSSTVDPDSSGDVDDDTSSSDTDEPPPPSCDGIGPAVDGSGTTPGETTTPFPTLRNATVEWAIEGDDDNDGVVTIRYRTSGDGTWREGLPLRRVPAGEAEGFAWANRHSGSVFDLDPATTYEVELALADPDGGCEIRTIELTTRAIPSAMAGAPVIAATPANIGDVMNAAVPGDVIELEAGTYGELTIAVDGTAGAPIVVRGSEGTTIDGDLRADGRSFLILEGLHVIGQIKFNDAHEIAIVGNVVDASEDGIVARTRSENLYIADNVVTGSTTWYDGALGVDGDNIGEGILVTGPGHVIEHNRVTGFRDGISLLEDGEAVDQYSIDIVGNDISEAADDGVEADFCAHNCRIVGNRLTNTFIALSSQPGLGGPTYFIRNAVFSTILSAFKLQRGSVGDVVLHNTIVKGGDALGIYTEDVFSRQYFRNNLFLGGPGGEFNGWSSGQGNVVSLDAADASVDLDYDAYGSTLGTFDGRIGGASFASLGEMQANTTEVHAVQIDLSVFAAAIVLPENPFPEHPVADLRPRGDAAVVDVGVALPNVNDGFDGAGPDLGAYEAGAPLPAYGPR